MVSLKYEYFPVNNLNQKHKTLKTSSEPVPNYLSGHFEASDHMFFVCVSCNTNRVVLNLPFTDLNFCMASAGGDYDNLHACLRVHETCFENCPCHIMCPWGCPCEPKVNDDGSDGFVWECIFNCRDSHEQAAKEVSYIYRNFHNYIKTIFIVKIKFLIINSWSRSGTCFQIIFQKEVVSISKVICSE